MFLDDLFCEFSLESQILLIVKDLFKLKSDLNFSDLILTHKIDLYFH